MEKDEASYPVWAGPVSELVVDCWAMVSSHITVAPVLLLFPACTALPGLWAVPLRGNGAACIQRTALPFVGITDEFKSCSNLGKITFTSSPQVLFALLHQNQSPSPEGWHQLMEEQCFQRLWLLLTTHFWSKTPLINWSLPMDTQVPSFPATKTKLRCAGVITVNAPSLPYRSCFQREESGLKAIAQHSIAIFDFPPLRHRWGKRKQHETSPFLGLPKTSLCWRKAPCQVPCKTAFCYEFFWAWRHITRHILSTW